jgi:hypothetical protein
MAATVLAVAVVGVVGPITASYAQSRFAQRTGDANLLARQLLDEITAKPLVDPADGNTSPGPETGEVNRQDFNNADDYDRYADTTSTMNCMSGNSVAWTGNNIVYQRNVTVQYRAVPDGPPSPGGSYALVTVTVTSPNGETVKLQRLMADFPRLSSYPTP